MQRQIGEGILKSLPTLPPYSSALILSDATVYPLYGESLLAQLPFPATFYLAPQGEGAKRLGVAEECLKAMAKAGLDRESVVITLGGGSICDLGGFVASVYMRGIHLIHCPTTLLAMVDASIGGKSALNFAGEKNLVGTFHQPAWIIADPLTLETLKPEEIQAGYAEVVKKGMVFDKALLELEDIEEVVDRCTYIKERVCARDEKGQGERALLNWGHTFAHAIEVLMDYQIRHGEAVAIGMSCAAHLSIELGFTDESLITVQEEALARRGLSTDLPDLDPKAIVELMKRDKKSTKGKISCIVSRGIGQMEVCREVDPHIVEKALEGRRKIYLPCS